MTSPGATPSLSAYVATDDPTSSPPAPPAASTARSTRPYSQRKRASGKSTACRWRNSFRPSGAGYCPASRRSIRRRSRRWASSFPISRKGRSNLRWHGSRPQVLRTPERHAPQERREIFPQALLPILENPFDIAPHEKPMDKRATARTIADKVTAERAAIVFLEDVRVVPQAVGAAQ